jgi:hypothetical protein
MDRLVKAMNRCLDVSCVVMVIFVVVVWLSLFGCRCLDVSCGESNGSLLELVLECGERTVEISESKEKEAEW